MEGQQRTETEECTGLGGMAQEQDGHTVITQGDFQVVIKDLKDSSLQGHNKMSI
jgi:hypothetical protein